MSESPELDALFSRFLTDHQFFIETCINIKNKDRKIVPFIFNPIQKQFYEKYTELKNIGITRHIILKPRQLGFTTLVCALFLAECIQVPNTVAAIIAHDKESTQRIFETTKLMYEKLPEWIKPKTLFSSKKELVFEGLNSKIFIGTAGSGDFGRGTTINLLHASEVAFWQRPEDIMPSLLETVPASGVMIFETTANGFNHFYRDYKSSKEATDTKRRLENIAYPHFWRWFDHPEYQNKLEPEEARYIRETMSENETRLMKAHSLSEQQIAWRRSKISRQKEKFFQEYPEDDMSCFLSSGKPFFDLSTIKSIRMWNEENKTWDKRDDDGALIQKGWMKAELDNYVKIYKSFKQGEKYILAIDPAEGSPTSDYSSAFVLRLNKEPINIEIVAEINAKIAMTKFFKLCYHLGSMYGYAKMVIERNNHGQLLCFWAVNGLMQDQIKLLKPYPNLYINRNDSKPGFQINSANRPIVLDNLAELLKNNMLTIYSEAWLDQAQSFIYNESGRPEAETGGHDDAIMATAMGCYILLNEQHNSSFVFANKEDFGFKQQQSSFENNSQRTQLSFGQESNQLLLKDTAQSIDYMSMLGEQING